MTEIFDLLKEDDKQLLIGDSVALDISLYDAGGSPLTVPLGWTFEYFVRRGKSADEALIEKTTDITVISTENGSDTGVRIPLTEDDTKVLEQDTYYHTLRRADVGFRSSLFIGDVDFEYTAARTP
jgi:hypothetical protein